MSSLYQSAHEPSDTSLELKKKQHSIWGMNTLRKWAFDREQRFVNRVCLCRQHCLHFFLVQDRLLTLGISLRSCPGDTMSHRGKAERLWNSRLSDLLWAFVLNLSQDVPATARSQAIEQHCTQHLAPKEAHTKHHCQATLTVKGKETFLSLY